MTALIAGRVYRLPSAAMVGWIPLRPFRAPLPVPWQALPWNHQIAARAMLATGNPDPAIGSLHDFRTFVASSEFRLAIAVTHVRVTFDPATGVHLSARLRYKVGFTALRAGRTIYAPGVGRRLLKNPFGKGELKVRVRAKIGRKLNLAQSLLTGHLAPWAAGQVEYRVSPGGSYRIQFVGSRIPSQRFYVDWTVIGVHDLTSLPSQDFRGFVEAGDCVNASVARYSRYTGTC
jgi:hypothetical protein